MRPRWTEGGRPGGAVGPRLLRRRPLVQRAVAAARHTALAVLAVRVLARVAGVDRREQERLPPAEERAAAGAPAALIVRIPPCNVSVRLRPLGRLDGVQPLVGERRERAWLEGVHLAVRRRRARSRRRGASRLRARWPVLARCREGERHLLLLHGGALRPRRTDAGSWRRRSGARRGELLGGRRRRKAVQVHVEHGRRHGPGKHRGTAARCCCAGALRLAAVQRDGHSPADAARALHAADGSVSATTSGWVALRSSGV